MPVFYGAIDLSKNELRQAQVQNLSFTPGTGPANPVLGQLFYNTNDNKLYYCTNVVGPVWTAAAGSAGTAATTVTTSAVADAGVVGVATNYAREDHKHGREAFGTITAQTTFGAASGNGSATTVTRSDHTHGTPVHDATAHNAISRSAFAVPTADVPWGGFKITNLADPTNATDAANKQYVDNLAAGLSWKEAVRAATTVNGTIATAYANGQVIDGVTLVTGNRILIKNQTTGSENGIFLVTAGAPARASDADVVGELEGAAVFVQEGTVNADQGWVCTTNGAITPGVTVTAWSQFTGAGGPPSGAASGDLTGNYPGPTINAAAVTLAKMANLAANSIIGNNTGLAATPLALTGPQVLAMLPTAPLTVTQKYAQLLTGTTSPETVTHNLHTRDVQVTVLNGSSPYTAVEVDWDATTIDMITIRYNPNLGATYRISVMG